MDVGGIHYSIKILPNGDMTMAGTEYVSHPTPSHLKEQWSDSSPIAGDARGLSPLGESAVSALRDRVHTALYQHCADVCEPSKAAGRLARILLLLPQLYLISMEVVDHLRMRHTFALPYQLNPLSVQLFGDIFEEGRTDEPYLM
ncbi:unnamed protein product [Heligmosomoides polygyrus]|uniref:NR LBD domain-containing protein n=1 Tax=Heligmosomoides polygyrus TaxID=6339 RepID=A0A183GQ43_HELPZ|nr:unnamed protein product [Heligmosomoides polygyrus]